ncbi:MAG: helix-turn-helix transcriptional regulator [Methylococcales bacterium]|nr:helix-turn-helix transcriptional regulator [Methylococcales bacterium]
MRTWAEELQPHLHDYVRRGGKQNRKKQVSLIVDFLEYTDSTEKLTSLHRLGKRQVINFWKSHRDMSDKVAYDYWLGLCKLWVWIDKPGKPPRPNNFGDAGAAGGEEQESMVADMPQAIKLARESKKYTVQKLANLTGLECSLIQGIESGEGGLNITLSDYVKLFSILDIRFVLPG